MADWLAVVTAKSGDGDSGVPSSRLRTVIKEILEGDSEKSNGNNSAAVADGKASDPTLS